jgi:hypothetical protein
LQKPFCMNKILSIGFVWPARVDAGPQYLGRRFSVVRVHASGAGRRNGYTLNGGAVQACSIVGNQGRPMEKEHADARVENMRMPCLASIMHTEHKNLKLLRAIKEGCRDPCESRPLPP